MSHVTPEQRAFVEKLMSDLIVCTMNLNIARGLSYSDAMRMEEEAREAEFHRVFPKAARIL